MFGSSSRLNLMRRLLPGEDPALARFTTAQATPTAAAAAPPAAPPPAPAAPAQQPPLVDPMADEDAAVDVRAARPRAYDGPLAMDSSAQAYQAKKPGIWDRLAFAGAALTEGPTAAADMRRQWNTDQRAAWERGQTASSRQVAIEAVRRVIDREGDAHPELMRVAQMAGTPEAFLEWYAKWKEAGANRSVQNRSLDITEKGVDAEIRQGDRRLDQGDRELDITGRIGEERNRIDWFDANTRRQVADDSSPGRDPLERGLIANDVDQLQSFSASASMLTDLVPELQRFVELNETERGTGAGSLAQWFPFVNKETEEMRQITSSLAPKLRKAGEGAMSDRDMTFLLERVPNTGRSQEANRQVAETFMIAQKRAMDRERYGREYLRRDRSLATFNRLWGAYIAEASIASGDRRDFAQWMRDKERQRQQTQGAAR